MNIENVGKGIVLAYTAFAGFSAGYFTHKALNNKADEMLQDGGMLNAFTIGAGQMAISIAAGVMAYAAVKHGVDG